jgi:hypothetical protein
MFRRAMLMVSAATLAVCLLSYPQMDGAVMYHGKMMMMKSGRPAAPMAGNLMMSNGSEVMTDGTVKMKDGRTLHLKDGQMIMMDGKIMTGTRATRMANPMPTESPSE